DPADALLPQALLGRQKQVLEDPLPRLVMDDQIEHRVALGGGVLRVTPDVEVEAGAVLEEYVARPAPADPPAKEAARHPLGADVARELLLADEVEDALSAVGDDGAWPSALDERSEEDDETREWAQRRTHWARHAWIVVAALVVLASLSVARLVT